jgi:hypothetical protein
MKTMTEQPSQEDETIAVSRAHYEELHKQLCAQRYLHADETTVLQVLHEPGKAAQSKSFMWLYRTSGNTERPIVLFDYQPDRKAKCPIEFLQEFSGYLHTDGYAGYNNQAMPGDGLGGMFS